MSERPDAVGPACELIVDYLRSRGRDAEAQPYIDRYREHTQRAQTRQRERYKIRTTDTYLPQSLSTESFSKLAHDLARRAEVEAAYVVQKLVPEGEPPLHVVGVKRRTRMFRLEKGAADSQLIHTLASEITLAEDVVYISVNSQQKSFARRFKKVKGSRIK